MITGTDANMGTTPVRLEHLFDEQALVAWMVGNVEGFAGLSQLNNLKAASLIRLISLSRIQSRTYYAASHREIC